MKQELRHLGEAYALVGELRKPVSVDVRRFLESRLLITSTSGGGKSMTARKFLEATHGICPQIIIDPEGEFSSLRSKFDGYVLAAAKGGDVLINAQTAGLLAARTIQLNISIILDLYELRHDEKHEALKRFLDGLLAAPKDQWGPRQVFIDEVHKFCPEKGSGESPAKSSVIAMMDSGRKRGFGTSLATQRLSKLAKDAAAECWNKMIGPTAWGDDRIRAADEIGIPRKDAGLFKDLHPGEFMLAGPAFIIGGKQVQEATKVSIDKAITHQPSGAGKHRIKAPAPTAKVKAVLAKLGDLPKEAVEEARTMEDLRVRIRQLEQAARQVQVQKPQQVERIEYRNPDPAKVKALAQQIAGEAVRKQARLFTDALGDFGRALDHYVSEAQKEMRDKVNKLKEFSIELPKFEESLGFKILKATIPVEMKPKPKLAVAGEAVKIEPASGVIPEPQRKILAFLLTQPDGKVFTLKQVGAMTNLSGTTGTFSGHITSLVKTGAVSRPPGAVKLENRDLARDLAGGWDIATGKRAREEWLQKLGDGPKKVYGILLANPDEEFTLVKMAEMVGAATTGGKVTGTFSGHVTELSTLGLALRTPGKVRLHPDIKDL